jgi:peptidoglycan-N-acetylglucosamine deacetylase
VCNLSNHCPVKKASFVRRYLFCALAFVCSIRGPGLADHVVSGAEETARLIRQGNPRGAAVTVRDALNAEPGSHLLRQEAAALLLLTGDTAGASSVWKSLLEERPGDPLSLYGLGVVAIHQGERVKALELIRTASKGGDRAACLIAERYLESLSGATGAGLGLALPDAYRASARGLSGIAAARTGDSLRAKAEISDALAALPGDPFYETPGVLMTFSEANPIRFGFSPLPTGHGLAVKRGPSGPKVYSGVVTLAPDDTGTDVGFVAFKIDGALSKMVNTRPFNLVWDTAQFPNGPHRVEIIVYDTQGAVRSQADKVIQTSNADAPALQTQDSARSEAVRALLWEALALRPSRHILAYTGADAAQKLGDQKAALALWKQAAALNPEYGETRMRLEGVLPPTATPAVWRGDPSQPVIALTFDDGPKPGITERLVDILSREGVPSTFFVIGRHVTAYPDLVRKISAAGIQIENHTYTHPNLTMLSSLSVEAELLKTVASVHSITGRTMRYFRPPGGNVNNDVYRAASKWGLTACMWTLDADALENGSPDKLVDFVVNKATPGAIVLLHNGRQTTLDALPRIIAGLRQRGFRFDTIDGLLGRKSYSGGRLAPAGAGSG